MPHQKEKRMRKVLIAAGVVSMVSMATAQKLEVGIDGGLGFGYGAPLVGNNSELDSMGGTLKYEEVYASGGMGVKIRGEVVYFFTENMGILVASGYSMKNNYSTEVRDPSGGGITMKGTTSYLPLNIGLKFRAKTGIMGINVVPYAYVAPGIYFPRKTETTTVPSDTTVVTYFYEKGGFGVSAGVGAAIMLPFLSNRVGIKVEFSPTYAFANPTKYRKQVSRMGYPPIDSTYTYKDDKDDTPPEKLAPGVVGNQPHDSFCSMAVRVGVCIKIF
jgi:hypothetical protein